MKYYIKQRHNPQLGVYYVPCGSMSAKEAKKHTSPVYGHNIMMPFNTEKAYNEKLEELREKGEVK